MPTWLAAPARRRQGSAARALPAGVWARAVGRMAGVNVPLVAMHHAYVVTERIEGIQVSSWPPGLHQSAGDWLVVAHGTGSDPTHAGRHAERQWPHL